MKKKKKKWTDKARLVAKKYLFFWPHTTVYSMFSIPSLSPNGVSTMVGNQIIVIQRNKTMPYGAELWGRYKKIPPCWMLPLFPVCLLARSRLHWWWMSNWMGCTWPSSPCCWDHCHGLALSGRSSPEFLSIIKKMKMCPLSSRCRYFSFCNPLSTLSTSLAINPYAT